ncbi:hypothetical protein R5R35_002165 [Gryllus longicercus]|uniref:Uncharacterized protein n=1 Tax=Gryllus longicercus TaxID=2509291 RepID=A0AAN9VE10_9ORTH
MHTAQPDRQHQRRRAIRVNFFENHRGNGHQKRSHANCPGGEGNSDFIQHNSFFRAVPLPSTLHQQNKRSASVSDSETENKKKQQKNNLKRSRECASESSTDYA